MTPITQCATIKGKRSLLPQCACKRILALGQVFLSIHADGGQRVCACIQACVHHLSSTQMCSLLPVFVFTCSSYLKWPRRRSITQRASHLNPPEGQSASPDLVRATPRPGTTGLPVASPPRVKAELRRVPLRVIIGAGRERSSVLLVHPHIPLAP